MPLPAAWHTLFHVDCSGAGGPDPAACSDAQTDDRIRCGQPCRWASADDVGQDFRRLEFSGFPEPSVTPPRMQDGRRRGQRPLESRRALQPWLDKHRDVLPLDFLPPYSPELNPVERVWKLTRRLCTHNAYFETLESLIKVVSKQFTL